MYMKKIINLKKQNTTVRKTTKNWNIDNTLLTHTKQQTAINQLYLDISFQYMTTYIKELKHKLSGYKSQDKDKKIFDSNYFISLQTIYELLVKSKLFCYYCKNPVYILYEKTRDMKQWTLDRIDNDQGHNCENCVICCLECNLQRKTLNDEKFKFTKQFKLIKKE